MYENLHLLGPQRPDPNLRRVLDACDRPGPVAVFTAGWRLDEAETEALEADVGRECVHLPLYGWFEGLTGEDPALRQAYRGRQDRIRTAKQLYRIRLNAATRALHELLGLAEVAADLQEREVQRALDAVRDVDDQMLATVRDIRASFPRLEHSWEHPLVRRRHDQIAAALDRCQVAVVAGGHVAVLLNRMRFFGVDNLLHQFLEQGGELICWSAGAMVTTSRIALFYDDPPDGVPRQAEILDNGFGYTYGVVLFPHARLRLDLDNPRRVARLAKRFAPSVCIGVENGAWLQHRDGTWLNSGRPDAAVRFDPDGIARPLETA